MCRLCIQELSWLLSGGGKLLEVKTHNPADGPNTVLLHSGCICWLVLSRWITYTNKNISWVSSCSICSRKTCKSVLSFLCMQRVALGWSWTEGHKWAHHGCSYVFGEKRWLSMNCCQVSFAQWPWPRALISNCAGNGYFSLLTMWCPCNWTQRQEWGHYTLHYVKKLVVTFVAALLPAAKGAYTGTWKPYSVGNVCRQ